jgi:hypothetical protein
LTAAVSIYNLNQYISETYAPKSEEAFLYYKTGMPMKMQFIIIMSNDLYLHYLAGLIFLTAYTTVNFLNLAACITLLIGTLQKKKSCLVPYLLLTSLYILLYLALGIWFFLKSQEDSFRNGIVTIAVLGNFYLSFIFLKFFT